MACISVRLRSCFAFFETCVTRKSPALPFGVKSSIQSRMAMSCAALPVASGENDMPVALKSRCVTGVMLSVIVMAVALYSRFVVIVTPFVICAPVMA